MLTLLVFIFILGLLVFVHEFGHFVVARRNGIKCEEFGFGFPPRAVGIQFMQGNEKEKISEIESIEVKTFDMKVGKDEIIQETITEKMHTVEKNVPVRKWRIIWGSEDGDNENEKQDLKEAHKKKFIGGTIYSLNWIPIGGFVRIKGEDGDGKKDKDSFASKSALARIAVLSAGVSMNFILAWVLLSATFMVGTYQDVTGQNNADAKVLIESIEDASPAQAMGMKIGDVVLKDGQGNNLKTVADVQKYVGDNVGNEIVLLVQRGDEQVQLNGAPRLNSETGRGVLGISSLGEVAIAKYGFFESLWKGLQEMGNMFTMIGKVFGGLLRGQNAGVEVMGPIKMVEVTGQIIPLGFVFILRFIAIFSINLGVINILPFPALDGGRILFIIFEKIKGSPVSQKIEAMVHSIGMMILLSLMLFIAVRETLDLEIVVRLLSKINGIF